MPKFPLFLGGPSLGSNLNLSMTAKVAIVQRFLNIIFPGLVIYLVQGSPSGSSASGGTHLEDGTAGDFVYRYSSGKAVGLKEYIMASIIWRMLNCLSYVRGLDVDQNGVKDDSFDAHNHVIDREGEHPIQAVRTQINQFVAHLDGLVGGRPDREKVFPTPMNLADFNTPGGQALFLIRFQQLSSAALGISVHTEPAALQQEDDEDMSYVRSFTDGGGKEGFQLVTPFGTLSLGSMGDVDACLSAINARSARPMVNGVWTIQHPYPASKTEVDRLDYFEKVIRDNYMAAAMKGITVNVTAPPVDAGALTDAFIAKVKLLKLS